MPFQFTNDSDCASGCKNFTLLVTNAFNEHISGNNSSRKTQTSTQVKINYLVMCLSWQQNSCAGCAAFSNESRERFHKILLCMKEMSDLENSYTDRSVMFGVFWEALILRCKCSSIFPLSFNLIYLLYVCFYIQQNSYELCIKLHKRLKEANAEDKLTENFSLMADVATVSHWS